KTGFYHKKSGLTINFFQDFGVLLSLLSPVLSQKLSQQLITNQPFTDFSDSSDSKNGKTFSYVNKIG
ncbi:MAG: hypothetical protein J5965_05450, partial [Aeriscardovia sp.]|nr:hypothetical protein [Aeriscardovia sp.]